MLRELERPKRASARFLSTGPESRKAVGVHRTQGGLHRKPIGLKKPADHLKTDPRSLRVFLRPTERGTERGTGSSWPPMTDAAVKKIAADFKKAQAAPMPAGLEKSDEAER